MSPAWLTAGQLLNDGTLNFDLSTKTDNGIAGGMLRLAPLALADPDGAVSIDFENHTDRKQAKTVLLAVRFRGVGTADGWTSIPMLPFQPPPGFALPEGYIAPDNLRSISVPANGRSVIAVGAFAQDGRVKDCSQPGGKYGKDWKPLALAPVDLPGAVPIDAPIPPMDQIYDGLYKNYNGTSCAGPVMAGAGVLYLQKNPKASHKDFVAAVQRTAEKDAHTGDMPNAKCGYGKINFLELLK